MSELIELAKKKAKQFNLDGALVCAVIEQESNWDTWAFRYEPLFFQKYVKPLEIDNPTQARARAFSWGLCQVMGQTAREHGYLGPFTKLCDPETGIEWGCTVLSSKLTLAKLDQTKGLLFYNGGGNHLYPEQVLGRMRRYV